jgi:hypothetical protein
MLSSFFAGLPAPQLVRPVLVGFVLIALISLLVEAGWRKFTAISLASAGTAYLNGSSGMWQFVFCAVLPGLAYAGLFHCRVITLGCGPITRLGRFAPSLR